MMALKTVAMAPTMAVRTPAIALTMAVRQEPMAAKTDLICERRDLSASEVSGQAGECPGERVCGMSRKGEGGLTQDTTAPILDV